MAFLERSFGYMYDQLINGHNSKVNCRGNEQALDQCEIKVVGGNIDNCDVRAS